MKTNIEKIVKQSVGGQISHPQFTSSPYRISDDGIPFALPGTGAITYNVKIGDLVCGLAGDHIEPGVSMKNTNEFANFALNKLACIGNEAKVITGDAKGSKGIVTGKHGGINHILIYFSKDILEKLTIEDKIQIKAYGQGLEFSDYKDILIMNIDPEILEKMDIEEINGKLKIKVKTIIPAKLMGSGIGNSGAYSGDYDITTSDKQSVAKYKIDKLRFGDLVMLEDCDNSYGRSYKKGACSIGIIVHSDCLLPGHGPGVTTILTSKTDKIIPEISEDANIINYKKFDI